ncbi:alginate O-acetylation protein / membrane bound O-acyl transferase, MBOAT [Tolypothrix sp. NIES-4075]|uniref:MBOAT family O-acyltransferase n=1 Tax=Tolypothrix sp. NIES-4075 TaxID=2005459 RepID=UPI000B5C202C|nr:MBOAT family O-acyltransferase [Tolypothrix sp. NIES-4075]GAX42410.1 alginate O-acetylation protein / membrane bound O-acyl transferase, MBOAT [Tolypothrix sp. NIES-4075]
MLFNSYAFIFVFLPITLILFFSLASLRLTRGSLAVLTLASLVFYAYWSWVYLPLLLISIVFNYLIGKRISKADRGSKLSQILLLVGIGVNLALLGYYKYAGFFISSINHFSHSNSPIPDIILPLGISFYTFTQTAYLVDTYRSEIQDSNYDLLTYSLFVTFFPHLIAGPILHHKDMIPQFQRLRNFVFYHENLVRGLTLFVLGLSKKLLIADNLSPWVAPIFDHSSHTTFSEAWVGTLSYAFQLYFDFSGYCDMAIGLGWMLNINLPANFNSPYKAISISDFWLRWHITLSNFLRDYLYIPLGANRLGEVRQYLNLMITMLLAGLWHGANWTFVVFGGLHGVYLCVDQWWRKQEISLPKWLAWSVTFVALLFSLVFFRSHTVGDAIALLQVMIGFKGIVLPFNPQGYFSVLTHFGVQLQEWSFFAYLPPPEEQSIGKLIGLLLVVTLLPNTLQIMEWVQPTWRWATVVGILSGFCFLSLNHVAEFLYFQF